MWLVQVIAGECSALIVMDETDGGYTALMGKLTAGMGWRRG